MRYRMADALRAQTGGAAWDNEAAYFAGLGADEAAPASSPWYETLIKTAVPALTTAYMQQQLTKINVARLNAGQAPLTAAEFSETYQPNAANVSVGPDRTARNLIVAGMVGVAIFGAAKLLQGRRR